MRILLVVIAGIAGLLVGIVSRSANTDVYVFAENQSEFDAGRGMRCDCSAPIPGDSKNWKGEMNGGVCTATNGPNTNGKPYHRYRKNGTWIDLKIPANSCCTTIPENQPKLMGKKSSKSC